jgi:hypothetical protein
MVGLTRVQDVGAQRITVPENIGGDMSLHLGYEDDGYSDNGYWGHDDGTEDQCSGSVNAFIELAIYHAGSIALFRQGLQTAFSEGASAQTVVSGPGAWAEETT